MGVLKLQVNWVDCAVLLLVFAGVMRGRKRGMSQELLDVTKWFLVLIVAGLVYEPGGRMLAQAMSLSRLTGYLGMYALVLVGIVMTFALIRGWMGEKLVSADTFGSAEYYLGMMAGAFRYVCVILVCMAFLNARYFTPQEAQAGRQYQLQNYGSEYFPTLAGMQAQVFERSFTGRLIKDHFKSVLIEPTGPNDRGGGPAPARAATRRQRDLDAVMRR